ncbi:MAG: 50S ribosomal protein L22 [bacterium]
MAEIAKAKVKNIRAIPWKARKVINLVRGKNIDEAINIVSFMPQAAAKTVKKLLKSALANAGQRKGINKENLYIEKIFVDHGPVLKRFRPAPMGRSMAVLKRLSHITVILGEKEKKQNRRKRGAEDASVRT